MKRKIVSLVACFSILLSTAYAALWPDWALQAEDWAKQNGLDEFFLTHPTQAITRGQTALILYQAAGSPIVSDEIPFTDIPEQYEDAVTWVAAQGLVRGVGNERYAPNRWVTRQEFATILYRGAGLPAPYEYTLSEFADDGDVAAWARDAMRWCVGTGLIQGKSGGLLAPQASILVSEAVLILQRADDNASLDDIDQPFVVSSLDEMKEQLLDAMTAAEQPPDFDVRMLQDANNLEIDVRNLYYAILSEQPALKYAYDLQIVKTGDMILRCTFSYMPYRTGAYPSGFSGIAVSDLPALIQVATAHIGLGEDTPIRITDPALTVDDMNNALQQVGGSYVLCQLNRDGTAITYKPLDEFTYTDSLSRLQQIEALANSIVQNQTDSAMTAYEKAETLYIYLTENVKYDHRYYSEPQNMPYDSQTAYGAFENHLSICSGYAQALQILFEKAGIPCYTVSGSMGGEYHMWNIAYLNGAWKYFDATSDRGRADYWFNCFNVSAEQLTRYVWDRRFITLLTSQTVG